MQSKERVFSGIQPSGTSHLGTYLGALKNFVALQNDYETFYCIVDLHALTTPRDPKVLRSSVREIAAIYLAADILLYNAHLVPVGEDQRQHLELARTLARRFNHLYGETFVVPEVMIPKTGARIMALDEPTAKMSKSRPTPGGYISLLDEPDDIRRKIRRAKTDSGTGVTASPDKPAISNLLGIYAGLSDSTVREVEEQYEGKGYGDFKKDLAEVVVEGLSPIRKRTLELLDNPKELDALLEAGAEKARAVARPVHRGAASRMD